MARGHVFRNWNWSHGPCGARQFLAGDAQGLVKATRGGLLQAVLGSWRTIRPSLKWCRTWTTERQAIFRSTSCQRKPRSSDRRIPVYTAGGACDRIRVYHGPVVSFQVQQKPQE